MRLFSHINEFAREGFRALPVLLLTVEKTYLWSPHAHRIEKSGSFFSCDNLVSILQMSNSPLRVMGRKRWLQSEKSRREFAEESAQNEGVDQWWATWSDFDEALSDLYRADRGKPFEDRRVVGVEEERGWKWADEQFDTNAARVERARDLIRAKSLPPGIKEKVERLHVHGGEITDRMIKQVLRDARNHDDALLESRADLPHEPARHPEAIPYLLNRPATTLRGGAVSSENVIQMVEVALAVADLSGPEQFFEMLEDKKRLQVLRSGADEILKADNTIERTGDKLLNRIGRELESEPLMTTHELFGIAVSALIGLLYAGYQGAAIGGAIVPTLVSVPARIIGRINRRAIRDGKPPRFGALGVGGSPTVKWLCALQYGSRWKRAQDIHHAVERLRTYVRADASGRR